MLHNEAQNLLVKAYEESRDAQTAAKCFQVSTSTVYHLSGQMKKTGSVDLRTSQRGRKPALTEEDLHKIDQLIQGQADITIGERSVDKAPLNTPANTAILSSVRLNGETAHTTYSGGTPREKFLDYLENVLIPTVHKGDIVVMDNMRTHHVKEVRTLLQAAGIKLLYLPPYSPDFNPIEKMWSKIKAILRKMKIRSLDCTASIM